MANKHSLPLRPAFAHEGGLIVPGGWNADGLLGSARFCRYGSDTDAETLRVGSFNKAPGAVHGGQGRMIKGAPVVQNDWWEFASGTDAVRWPIAERSQFCIAAVIQTSQNPINSTATRPFIAGWYSQNAGFGSALLFASTTSYQGQCYDGVPALKSANLATNGGTGNVSVWRAILMTVLSGSLAMENLTADATTNTPTATTFTGRTVGDRAFTIGSPNDASALYIGGSVTKIRDIAVWDIGSSGAPDGTAKAAILAAFRAGAVGTSLAGTF